jgi:IS4 transposase
MILREMVERFAKQAPICTMIRAAMENVLAEERLNGLFEQTAERQENKELMFSTVAELMGLVACKIHPSLHAAYQAKQEQVGVTAKALYDKLQRMETGVSRAVVKDTAGRMAQIIGKMRGGPCASPVRGYRVKILDGNHLRRTERRIGELRELNIAPLPGHALVVLDPRLKLAIDVFPCEDAHAQERTLLPSVLGTVEERDLWIADRNFCTTDFLAGISKRQGCFVIRQHGNLRVELIGKRKAAGRTETGRVYEQEVRLLAADGLVLMTLRRITIQLDQQTRDGDREIHLLTNLPPRKVTALAAAELYRKRWTIEAAFAEIAKSLQAEIETLGYPKAALFAFCMALVVYNVLSVVQAALRAAHGEAVVADQVSFYYLCDEVAATYRGLLIAIPAQYWTRKYAKLTPAQMAKRLIRMAQQVDLSRYLKHKRGPKKPKPSLNKKYRGHASTARILAQHRTIETVEC